MNEKDTASVEVTDAMIQAGRRVLQDSGLLWLETGGVIDEVVRDVFFAMRAAHEHRGQTETRQQIET